MFKIWKKILKWWNNPVIIKPYIDVCVCNTSRYQLMNKKCPHCRFEQRKKLRDK